MRRTTVVAALAAVLVASCSNGGGGRAVPAPSSGSRHIPPSAHVDFAPTTVTIDAITADGHVSRVDVTLGPARDPGTPEVNVSGDAASLGAWRAAAWDAVMTTTLLTGQPWCSGSAFTFRAHG